MNGPSISRRPVGRKSIGQAPGNVAQQQPIFQGPPGAAPMSAAPVYAPAQMMPQSAPYQAGQYYPSAAAPPMSGQPPVMEPVAQAPGHWPASSTAYQNPAYPGAPQQKPSYIPTPAQTPAPHPIQSPGPPMAHAAQVRASVVAPSPQPGGPRPPQISSPTPSMVQNYPSPTGTNVVSPGQAVSVPAMGPQLQRLNTSNSIQSLATDFDRRLSLSSNNSVGTPLTTFSTPDHSQQGVGTPDGNTRACASCKQAIPQNLSVFTCLVCSTADISTHICVWCYTTGAAASSHEHDTSYLATDSDMRVQERVAYIMPQQWTIRKNASGRLWYTYNETGYRTHLQPQTGVVYEMDVDVGIPRGWQQMKTAEGKLYYYNQGTGASSWAKPKNEVPPGWKVMKTPDGVLFYVHEALRISTWDRPGEQPKSRTAKASPTGPPIPAGAAVTAGPVARVNSNNQVRQDAGSRAASKMVMAANVANNVAKLSAASDMSPAGFLTAGVAAAKLTGLGLKVAGKKVGNLGKRKNMYAAANFIGAAATVAGVVDGDYDGSYFPAVVDVEEVEEVEVTQTTDISTDQATYFATESDTTYTMTEQAYPQQGPIMMIIQDQLNSAQQPSYLVDQMSSAFVQNLGMAPDQFQQPQGASFEEPSMVTNNVNVTVQETLVNETIVQDTQYTGTSVFFESSQDNDANQYARPDAVITNFSDLSWADPSSLFHDQGSSATPEPQFVENQFQQPSEVILSQEAIQQPQVVEPPQTTDQPQSIQQPLTIEQPESVQQPQFIQQPLFIEQPSIIQQPTDDGQPLVIEQPPVVLQPFGEEQPQLIQQPLATYPSPSPIPESEVNPPSEIMPLAPPVPPEASRPSYPDSSTTIMPSSQTTGGAPPVVFDESNIAATLI